MKNTLLIFCAFFIPYLAATQDNMDFENSFKKMEKLYALGKYVDAERKASKLLHQINKKGDLTQFKIATKALWLKYQSALGFRLGNNTELKILNQEFDSSNAYFSDSCVFITRVSLASTANQYRNYKLAYGHIKALNDSSAIQLDHYWFPYLNNLELSILQGMKNYQEAELILEKTFEEDSYNINDTTKTVSRKALKELKKQQLLLNVLRAELALNKGNVKIADSLFTCNDTLKLGSKKTYLYTRNKVGSLQSKIELDQTQAAFDYKKVRVKYANNMHYAIPNQFYLDIFKKDLIANLESNNYRKFDKSITQFQRETVKNYSRKSAYQFTARYFDYLDELYKGKYKSFEKHMNKAAQKSSQYYDPTDANQIEFLEYLAQAETGVFNFSSAENTYKNIIKITNFNNDSSSANVHKANLELGSFYVNQTNKFIEADSIFSSHYSDFVNAQLHPFHSLYQKYLADYAKIHYHLDRYDSAIYLSHELIKHTQNKHGKLSYQHALALAQLGKTQFKKGEFYKAEMSLFEAKEILIKLKFDRSQQYVLALQSIGQLMAINGNLEQSEKTLTQAIEIAKKHQGTNAFLVVGTNQSLADYYVEVGNYDAAQKITETNISLTQKSLGYRNEALISQYQTLSRIHLTTGQLVLAEKFADSALRVANHIYGKHSLAIVRVQSLLGSIYLEMGDFEQAQQTFTNAIQIYQEKQTTRGMLLAKLIIGNCKAKAALTADYQSVITTLNIASDIVIENTSDQHPKLAEIMELKAKVYIQEEQFSQAFIQLQSANFIYLSSYGEKHYKTADNMVNLGNLYYDQGEYVKAHETYNSALDIYNKNFSTKHPKYVKTIGKIGKTFYAQKNYENAYDNLTKATNTYIKQMSQFFPSLTERQKSKYWNSVKEDFEIYKSLAITHHKQNPTVLSNAYNHQLATKAILLSSTVKMKERINTYGSTKLKEKYSRWQELNNQYISLLSTPSKQQKEHYLLIEETKTELQQLEKELSESAEGFAANSDNNHISWSDVKSNLSKTDCAIEIIRANYFETNFTDSVIYMALIVSKDSKNHPVIVLFPNGNAMESTDLNYYNNSMREAQTDLNSFQAYWQRIEHKLGGIKNIYLSSDGVYNQLNPETFSETPNDYLINKYQFHFVSNTKTLAAVENENEPLSTRSAVFFGNPFFGELENNDSVNILEITPLLGAEKEVYSLDSLLSSKKWNTKLFVGKDATESALNKVNNPTVLHIATHGFFNPADASESSNSIVNQSLSTYIKPLLYSGLMFANSATLYATKNPYQFNSDYGILTAYEAMNLSLDQTKLVFLSACETGKGELVLGEGVYGLQRAFTIAGAQNVIMTLFKVDDNITKELAIEFYNKYTNGNSIKESLSNAKRAIASKYHHPKYWGVFKLTGKGN